MAIITLADYKSITDSTLTAAEEAYVNTLIPIVQNQVEIFCDRKFDSQDYLEWYKYSRFIMLKQYPITSIKYIGELDEVAEFDNSDDYTYEVTSSSLVVTDADLTSTTINFGAGVDNLTDIKTAYELSFPGETLTIRSGYTTLSYKLLRYGTGTSIFGARRNDCQTKLNTDENRTLEILMDSAFQFWMQTDKIIDTNIFIAYTAGYSAATMPKALQKIVCNIIQDVKNINDAGITGLYQSENITNYSYSLGADVTKYVGQELTKYTADLESFRKKTV